MTVPFSVLHISYIYTIPGGNHRSTHDAKAEDKKMRKTVEKLEIEKHFNRVIGTDECTVASSTVSKAVQGCDDHFRLFPAYRTTLTLRESVKNADKQKKNQRASVSVNQRSRCSPVPDVV